MKLHWHCLLLMLIIGGGVIIDGGGGANNGYYTTALLKTSSSQCCKIIMVEPAPSLYKILKNIVNIYPDVAFEPVAIGSGAGVLKLFFDNPGSGLASLYQRDLHHVGAELSNSVEVPVVTLDDLAAQHGLSSIDYLKLDLEGHELEALKGAKTLLQQNKIRAICFEFGGCNIDSRTFVKDFWQLLVYEYGFTMYRLAPGRTLISLSSYSESLERYSWQNILACAPGVKPKWKVVV